MTKDIYSYSGPRSLYKYRPFDKYTFDMLENKYVFLCVASALDDPSECVVTIDKERYLDVQEAKENNITAARIKVNIFFILFISFLFNLF